MADGNRRGGIFSLGRNRRGTDAGAGALVELGAGHTGAGAGRFGTDVVVGRALTPEDIGKGVEIPEPVQATADAYTPYGESWKEFDRLKRAAKGGGLLGALMQHWWYGGVSGILSLFDPHKHARPYERDLFFAAVIVGVLGMARARWASSRLAHWPCPRCHSEWPGKKTDKDPRCNVCGLKLHQLMP